MSPRKTDGETEYDVEKDENVARSRAGKEDDGTYVGREFSDDAIDAGETGAEVRSRKGPG